MKVHHLNCASLCPVGSALHGIHRAVCHCLLVESDEGLILVDTGLGRADHQDPARLGPLFRFLLKTGHPHEAAIEQVRALGFDPNDVRHLVLTHLDLDHAGGLADFPKARVHVLELEQQAALARRTHMEKARYLPSHWAHGPKWETYQSPAGEPWFGFDCVRGLRGLPPEILMVPLDGHTIGHAAVAVKTADRWIVHAGDAYFHRSEVDPAYSKLPPAMGIFRWAVQTDGTRRIHNQERLRALNAAHGSELQLFCAHDPVEYDRAVG